MLFRFKLMRSLAPWDNFQRISSALTFLLSLTALLPLLSGCQAKIITLQQASDSSKVSKPTPFADHLVVIAGDNQTQTPGSTLSSLRVQVVDQEGSPFAGGIDLALVRMVGFDNQIVGPATAVTDSSGYAQFSVKLGYGPLHEIWEVVPVGATLPDTAHTGGTSVRFQENISTSGNGSFNTMATYSTGASSFPFFVAVGDFDNDGNLDLASANDNGTNVGILLGNGDGTFQSQVPYSTGAGSWPYYLALGDLNADGNLDIVVANHGGNNVGVLLGNGDGTFQAQVPYSTGAGTAPYAVAIGDFNADGKPDLAVTCINGDDVEIFLGNGDGTFQSPVGYSTGSNPMTLEAADLNGDGKLDLATADYDGGDVEILLGNGDGTFQNRVNYTTGGNSGPQSVALGDFNDDGKLDLVAANYLWSFLGIYLGNGDGTLQAQTQYVSGTLSHPPSVAVGDFNADGMLDFTAINSNTSTVGIIPGNGDGTFQAQTTYSTGSFSGTEWVAVGDFNGDGKLDLVTSNSSNDNLGVFIGK